MTRLNSKIYSFRIVFYDPEEICFYFRAFDGERYPFYKFSEINRSFTMPINGDGDLEPFADKWKYKMHRKNMYLKLSEFMNNEFCLLYTKWLVTYTNDVINNEQGGVLEECIARVPP